MPRLTPLLRRPLTYLLLGECLAVFALGVAVWHLVLPAHRAVAGAPSEAGPDPGLTPEPLPSLPSLPFGGPRARPSPSPSAAGGATAPGLPGRPPSAAEPAFWSAQLTRLNRDQSDLQRSQWRLIDEALAAARGYLDTVVVPAVEAAAQSHKPRTRVEPG